MTQTTPPADPAWSAPPAAPVVIARPGRVIAAGITLIVLGVLTILLGLLLLLGAAIFAGAASGGFEAAEMPGLGGMLGAFAGIVFVLAFIVAGFGVLQLLAGIKTLSGRNWARITGIVVAAIGGVLALTGIGDPEGAILSIVLVAANAFVIFALATAAPWFSARAA